MTESLDRRKFLTRTATVAVIIGFPWTSRLSAGEDGLLDAAKKRMKEEVKPGIFILFPENQDAQNTLGHILEQMLHSQSASTHQLFCVAVFVCIPPSVGKAQFADYKPEGIIRCLDLDGKIVESRPLPGNPTESSLVAEIQKLIDGEQGARLKTWAVAQRHALGVETADRILKLRQNLSADEFQKREDALKELTKLAPTSTAILAEYKSRTNDPEATHRLNEIFTKMFNDGSKEQPSVQLPYGVQWAVAGGCGGHCTIAESRAQFMVKCGMAMISADSARFLRFTTGTPVQ